MYYEKYLNDMHTSSGWASDEEIARCQGCLSGQWSQPHQEGGVVLSSQGGQLIADGGRECRHVLVIGATGTGKSRLIIMPSLLYSLTAENKRSFVVFDVKGELEAATSEAARRHGYRIRRVDFRHPAQGNAWNPFAKLNRLYKKGGKSREEAQRLLEGFIASIFNDGENTRVDPFWRGVSSSLFRGICATIWGNDMDLNLSAIMELSNSIPGDRDEDTNARLFRLAGSLPPSSTALRNLACFRNASNLTRGNVLTTYNTYIAPLNTRDDILQMMSSPVSLDFHELGIHPTVLYISLPDDSVALGALQGILLTQLMQDLNECAMEHGGCLPVRTEMYLDELCNIHPAIPSLETALTIARSRGIRYILAIQSYNQLYNVYGAAAETIAANCSTWIALNISKDETFRSKLSQLCGNNPLDRPLITPAQLALLRYGEGIVIRERTAPYFTQLEDVGSVLQRMQTPDQQENARETKASAPDCLLIHRRTA